MLVESFFVLALVRIGLRLLPWSSLRRLLGFHPAIERNVVANDPGEREKADRIAWAIPIAARRFPIQMTCLIQALAADAMLRRRKCHPVLRLGVNGGGTSAIEAHAWVECGGRIVVGDLADLPSYAVLTTPTSR